MQSCWVQAHQRAGIPTGWDIVLDLIRRLAAAKGETADPDPEAWYQALTGAMPITHSACTVVKVNGDYLDHRLKNTREELSAYDVELNDLLDRIFDEFGLIVCGWSGEWDTALRSVIERVSTRRFGTYWTTRSKPSPVAEKLIALRRHARCNWIGERELFNRSDPVKKVLEK
jgi:hypothetical protein